MKTYSALAIVTAMLVMEPLLRAQSCSGSVVDLWTGSYTLKGITDGAVTCGGSKCTTNQSVTVTVNLRHNTRYTVTFPVMSRDAIVLLL